jgi:acyl-CoA synthetase (AMP-forming)/AMP-acid ligase II
MRHRAIVAAVNLADNLSAHARAAPHAVAVIERDRVIDFGAFDRAVWRAAAALRAQGIRPGDTVALAAGDGALHLVAGFALARMGAVQLALPRGEAPAYRRQLAARHRAVALIGDDAQSAFPGIPLLRPDPAWLEPGGAPPDETVRAGGGDAGWMIVLTSGTTAAPKAVLQTHAQYRARRALNSGPGFFLPGDRYFSLMSLDFHLGYRTCVDALWWGASVVLGMNPRTWPEFFELVDRLGVNWLFMVPSHLHKMIPNLPADAPRFPAVRVLRVAAMTASEALRREVRERLTPSLVISYGVNDLGCALTQAGAEAQASAPGSVGPPLPGVELEIVDESGRALPAGETGLVRVRIPAMPPGYIDNAQASAAAFRDGWFYPGDLGVLAPGGALTLRGRADDMMNCDGIKIYPADIEAALLEHPAVAEAAALPLGSERHQHIPVAAVVARSAVTGEALREWCRERLAERAPRYVCVVQELPRNEMGKVRTRELGEQIRRELNNPGSA